MIVLMISVYCIISMICLNFYKRQFYNPLFVYLLFWMILIFLSSLHLNGLYVVRNEIYEMFALGIIAFSLGFLLTKKYPLKEINKKNKKYSYLLSYRNEYIMLIISIIFLLTRLGGVILSLKGGTAASDVRDLYYSYDEENQSSKYTFYLQTFIITPIVYSSAVLMVMDLINGKKDKINTILTIVNTVLFIIISGGGRVVIMNYMFHIIFLLLILKKKVVISAKLKRRIRSGIIALIIVFFVVNSFRGKENNLSDVLDEAYKYYAGAIPHFQVRIDALGNVRDYGVAFIAGYLRPLLLVLGLIGIKAPDCYNVFLYQNSLLQKGVLIGEDVWYNAFATMNFHFYLSFGTIGIIIGNYIFGAICSTSYKKEEDNKNYWTIGFLLLILQGILTSMVRWQFCLSTYALSFIYLRLALKRVQNKENR